MTLIAYRENGQIIYAVDEPAPENYGKIFAEQGLKTGRCHRLETSDLLAVYVADGAVTKRPSIVATVTKASIAADGKDKAVISRLPRPCTILIDGVPVTRKGGALTLTSDMPGDYRISVDQWPYLPWSVEIVAR